MQTGDEGSMDAVFRALGDATRRQLLDDLNTRNGQSLRELCADRASTRQSVSKHLAVLEAANLITTRWRGREKLHYLNAEPINAIADRWIQRYERGRVTALADLKRALEQTPMGTREFVHTSFIRTTPEHLWQALTDPTFTTRYWGVTFESDWQVGSPVVWVLPNGARIADPAQVVLESDPHRLLSYTWHSFTPEFAAAYEMDPAEVAKLAEEPRTKVRFEIEPRGEVVRLTVVHEGFAPDSALLDSIGGGWSELLSSLKTLLETGEPLPAAEPEPQPAGQGG